MDECKYTLAATVKTWEDLNQNGIYEESEPSLPNIKVQFGRAEMSATAEGITNEQGLITLTANTGLVPCTDDPKGYLGNVSTTIPEGCKLTTSASLPEEPYQFGFICSNAPTEIPVSDSTTEEQFNTLFEQLKNQNPDLDFSALRLVYSRTEAYNPYNGEEDKLIEAMWAAINASDFNQALELANQALVINAVSPRAHTGAYYACDGLGKKDEADFHRYAASGIIDSILASGDGKSPQTAYVVIAVPEEYVILSVLGVKVDVQQWDTIDGHNYDFFDVVDKETNEKSVVYFNIDIPWNWLSEQLR
jgi:hypothetical protein